MNKKTIMCDVCGEKRAEVKRLSRSFGKGASLLVIDNIPIVVCQDCGESYMTAETLREIDRLKLHGKLLKVKRTAPVISYA